MLLRLKILTQKNVYTNKNMDTKILIFEVIRTNLLD